MFTPNNGVSATELDAFEREIGFRLPLDYRSFLEKYNGGHFSAGYPDVSADTIGRVAVNCLFGLGMPTRALDLSFWHTEFDGELPSQAVLIGADPGGGLFLLCCSEDEAGVYYYDHAYGFPTSGDDANTYYITNPFGNMAKGLGILP